MEYQFTYDLLNNPVAKCELECELFGDWLSYDLGNNKKQVMSLLESIKALQSQHILNFQHIGKTYHLLFDKDEVILFRNNNELDSNIKIDIDWDNEESFGCGLVDLQNLLESWLDFIH